MRTTVDSREAAEVLFSTRPASDQLHSSSSDSISSSVFNKKKTKALKNKWAETLNSRATTTNSLFFMPSTLHVPVAAPLLLQLLLRWTGCSQPHEPASGSAQECSQSRFSCSLNTAWLLPAEQELEQRSSTQSQSLQRQVHLKRLDLLLKCCPSVKKKVSFFCKRFVRLWKDFFRRTSFTGTNFLETENTLATNLTS